MKRTGLFLAIMLVIVVNIAALAGVWYNRTGPPDAVITLTERELPLFNAQEDDSGIALRIAYRRAESDQNETWLDRAKLEELGFDYPEGEVARNFHLIRTLFLVLELEDEAEESKSRLIAMDAGIDAEELRRRYGDRSRYIIAPGIVRLFLDRDEEDEEKLNANVQHLLTSLIHVPKTHSAFLAGLEEGDGTPRYAVTLRYGRKLEPWVVKVEPLEAPTP
jgi:hypothetical protein